jgi:hypothetical protein
MAQDMGGAAAAPAEGALALRLYELATGEDDARLCRDIPEAQCHEQPHNFIYQVTAQALSKVGDTLSDSKVVLPWLLGALGAPASLVALLVPIRESLALLPQILVGGYIRHYAVRKGWWVVSSIIEGLCILAMAGVSLAGMRGAAAGWTIIALLTAFSTARGVASIAAKDTLGKTVSKGRRGRVNGHSAMAAGIVAAAVGLYLAFSPEATRPPWLLYAMIGAAGACWFLAAATFQQIVEFPGATEGGRGIGQLARDQFLLLIKDPELQKFLAARALMISTALVGPLYVTLAQRTTGEALSGLGWLVVATGLASAISSSFWGSLSDRSSRLAMALAAGMAGVLGFAVLAALAFLPAATESIYFYAGVLFLLNIAHAGVRIGRKTHVVDIAGGAHKAEYVALSNSIIGVLLLVIGGIVGVLMALGVELALGVLSALALLGAAMAMTMKNAQA